MTLIVAPAAIDPDVGANEKYPELSFKAQFTGVALVLVISIAAVLPRPKEKIFDEVESRVMRGVVLGGDVGVVRTVVDGRVATGVVFGVTEVAIGITVVVAIVPDGRIDGVGMTLTLVVGSELSVVESTGTEVSVGGVCGVDMEDGSSFG